MSALEKGSGMGVRRGVGVRGRTVGGLYIAASVGRYCIDRKDIVSPTEGYNEAGGGVGGEEEVPARARPLVKWHRPTLTSCDIPARPTRSPLVSRGIAGNRQCRHPGLSGQTPKSPTQIANNRRFSVLRCFV